jgi:endonuclease/exonuclease/phosphatase family metal-dependent hydrolase
MTFNLRYENKGDSGPRNWNNRRDTAAAIIRDFKSDVVGLQEALRSQLDDLATRLQGFAETGVGRDDGKTAGEYSAILYRRDVLELTASGTFWLSDTPETPGSRSWGNTIPRICSWASFRRRSDGLAFDVYNAHFDHQSQPSREKSAAAIVSRLQPLLASRPVFFMGDLNAGEDNPAISTLKSAGFRDTWRALHPDMPAADASTFHNFTGSSQGSKIDYIFAPATWSASSAEIIRTPVSPAGWPSDHFPVTAVVSPLPAPR